MLHQMQVKALMADPVSQTPLVLLRGVDSDHELRIWIGSNEANAIALEIENIPVPRPMTHDLLRAVIQQLDATVVRVIVSELKNDTFFAIIEIYHAGTTLTIDSRPSDAIALALRTNAPIFVSEEVLMLGSARTEAASDTGDIPTEPANGAPEGWEADNDSIKTWLDNLSPDDFDKG